MASFDNAVLSAARSHSLTIQWVPVKGTAPEAAPEEIGQQLAGQADFFLMITYKCLPEVHEQFPALHQSYTNRQWTEIRYRETSHTGMPRGERHWTMDEGTDTA